jgi:hypothetical protein
MEPWGIFGYNEPQLTLWRQGHRLPIAQIFHKKFRCNVVLLSYRGSVRLSVGFLLGILAHKQRNLVMDSARDSASSLEFKRVSGD